MLALDVMTKQVITVNPETPVRDVARIFADNHISGAPVVDEEGRLLGIVTEGDLLHRSETGTGTQRRSWWLDFISSNRELAATYIRENGRSVRDVMTEKVISVQQTTPISEIADLLERHRIKRVPVLRAGQLFGIVSRANLVKALASVPYELVDGLSNTDREIRETVLRELKHHRWSMADEAVLVTAGVVHLWGVVASAEQARAMCVAAENVLGVKGVKDHTNFPIIIPAV